MRKSLSDERTLSLSYVFFISHKSRLLSQFNTSEKSAIMNNLNITKGLNSIEETTVLTCFHVLKILQDKKVVNEQDANDEMDKLRTTCVIQQSKTATRIVSSLLYKYFSSVQKDSESNLTIETLRPFIKHIIVSTCADIKLEWMSYRMSSGTNDGQMMIPDLALYIDPLSVINFELFIVEVKKHGNFSNGTLENDMIKLGKEMKLAVDKLITHKVDSPEIIGLLIRGLNVTVMKMDLQYNGQYRLIEISTFFLVRDTIDDIMLIPSIIQKLDQVRQIIQDTMEKIYKAIRKELCSTRVNNTFMRKGCHSPVTVKKE
ncbi:hypothetical protein HPULCUR_006266 [Helicostylum pulchrum]|uniref:Uncharacterized protein n=1 Tax=Helicostylum pulchrum TaxID=562976 RepID=A0ABP9Y3D4_9FUNG